MMKRKTLETRQMLVPVMLVLLLAILAACGPSAEPSTGEAPESQEVEPTAEALAAEIVAPAAEEAAPPVEETQTAEELQPDAAEESYPPKPPERIVPEENYPVETPVPPTATPIPDVYPPPTVTEVFAEPRIQLDLPIVVGDTTVSGTAPAGLALAVVDVTYNGALLGTGTAGNDGRFTIPVEGLIEGNRLGLTFGELESGLSMADMSIKYYPHRGEGFMNLPNVGIMLDSTLIQP